MHYLGIEYSCLNPFCVGSKSSQIHHYNVGGKRLSCGRLKKVFVFCFFKCESKIVNEMREEREGGCKAVCVCVCVCMCVMCVFVCVCV